MRSRHAKLRAGHCWRSLAAPRGARLPGAQHADLLQRRRRRSRPRGDDDPPPITNGVTLRFRKPDRRRSRSSSTPQTRRRSGYDVDVPWISRDKVHLEVLVQGDEPRRPRTGDVRRRSSTAPASTRSTTRRSSRRRCSRAPNDPTTLPAADRGRCRRRWPRARRFSGIVREDDFAEGELDLDALGRWNDRRHGQPDLRRRADQPLRREPASA